MFNRRPDGIAVGKHVDPITRATPYFMGMRCDAQVMTSQELDEEAMSAYIRKRRDEDGVKISRLAIIIAAYVRVISQLPSFNRFVISRKLYARNELTVAFVVMKKRTQTEFLDTMVKVHFDPTDTVDIISERINRVIEENRKVTENNNTDKIINVLFSVPGLAALLTGIIRLTDSLGILPKAIIDASPFHASLVISDMASIRMGPIFHHIYNFGNVGALIGMGHSEKKAHFKSDGTIVPKEILPIGCVIDERISAGAQFGMGFNMLKNFCKHPEQLEVPPQEVRYDIGLEYHYSDEANKAVAERNASETDKTE